MRKLTRDEVLSSFTRKERKKLKLPQNFDNLDWDNLDFLSWIHPSGHLGYIVYEDDDGLKSLVLSRSTKPSPERKATMCSFCLTIHNSMGAVMFSAKVKGDVNRSVGDYFCSDLQCSLRLRGLIEVGPNQMRETISRDEKISRLVANLKKYLDRVI